MSQCDLCSVPESSDLTLATCDRCRSAVCKSCANLTSTELRAVLLQKRTIIYLCPKCRPLHDVFLDLATMRDSIIEQVKLEVGLLTDTLRSGIIADVRSSIGSLANEVSILKESNKDLIQLFTGGQSAGRSLQSVFKTPLGTPASSESNDFVCMDTQRSAAHKGQPQPLTVPTCKKSSSSLASTGASLSGTSGSPPESANANVHSGNTNTGVQSSSTTRIRPTPIVGSRKDPNLRIVAANIQRKSSVFVSRLDGRVSAEDLLVYLHSTFDPHECFRIEEQPVKSGDYRSFRVEARVDLLDRLLCAANWPENVFVKRFRFFQRRFSASK